MIPMQTGILIPLIMADAYYSEDDAVNGYSNAGNSEDYAINGGTDEYNNEDDDVDVGADED